MGIKNLAITACTACMALNVGALEAQPSLYNVQDSPYATFIARNPGDLLTVIVDETSYTDDNGERKHTRESSVLAELTKLFIPRIDAREGLMGTNGSGDPPGVSWETESSWDAKSENTSDHSFKTKIQVQLVEEVTPGQFIIRGIRKINLNGKERDMYISGVVRQRDITPKNTIYSHQVADAHVEIDGDVGGTDVRESVLHKIFNFIF